MNEIFYDVYGFPYGVSKNIQLNLIDYTALTFFTHGNSLPKVVHVVLHNNTGNKKTTIPAVVFTKANFTAYKKRISMTRKREGSEYLYIHCYYPTSGAIYDSRIYL